MKVLLTGGNGFVGTGIPDSIKQGEEIAARIAQNRLTVDSFERVTADGLLASRPER